MDGQSTDGTLEYLRELEVAGRIRLIVKKCTRGQGRQLAVVNATGEVLVQQVDADQLYQRFFQSAADRYEAEVKRDPDVLLMFVPEGPLSPLERLTSAKIPSFINFVSKIAFMSKTNWPFLNRGEDLHVWDPFIIEGHYVEAYCSNYAEQVKGGLVGTLLTALRNQKELMDSGFSFRWVVNSTRFPRATFYSERAYGIPHLGLAFTWLKRKTPIKPAHFLNPVSATSSASSDTLL